MYYIFFHCIFLSTSYTCGAGRLDGRPPPVNSADLDSIVTPRFSSFSLMLRERERTGIAATASMHITLQIPFQDNVMAAIG